MNADASGEPQHYNPLLVTVLPPERRARHPYQLAAMLCLLSLGAWQLAIGTQPSSSVSLLDQGAASLVNWVCVLGGAAGVFAAFVPERIVHWRICIRRWVVLRYDFDATWLRLWEELGCHLMLSTVWASYGLTVWESFGFIKGYSYGLAAALCFGGAAVARAAQIVSDLKQSGFFRREPTAIVSSKHPAAPRDEH